MPEPSTKRCTRCGEVKPLDQFSPHGNRGRHEQCKPCRVISNGISRRAHPETEAAHRARRRPQLLAGKLHYREERRAELAAKQREYNRTHQEQRRAYQMKRREEYAHAASVRRLDRMEKLAGRPRPNQCEVCGRVHDRITFDHDHQTNAFRGWLCFPCNAILGLAKDNPETLLLLVEYLRRNSTPTAPCR